MPPLRITHEGAVAPSFIPGIVICRPTLRMCIIRRAFCLLLGGNLRGALPHAPQGSTTLDPYSDTVVHTFTPFSRWGNTCAVICVQKTITILKNGYGTATVHGLGGVPPPAGCCASGENKKKPTGKYAFRVGLFHYFHNARGLCYVVNLYSDLFQTRRSISFAPSSFTRKIACSTAYPLRGEACRGNAPARGYRGQAAPCSGFPYRKNANFVKISCIFVSDFPNAKRGKNHAKNKQKYGHNIRRNPSQKAGFVL